MPTCDIAGLEIVDQLDRLFDQTTVNPGMLLGLFIADRALNGLFIGEMTGHFIYQGADDPVDLLVGAAVDNGIEEIVGNGEEGTVLTIDFSIAGFIAGMPVKLDQQIAGCIQRFTESVIRCAGGLCRRVARLIGEPRTEVIDFPFQL